MKETIELNDDECALILKKEGVTMHLPKEAMEKENIDDRMNANVVICSVVAHLTINSDKEFMDLIEKKTDEMILNAQKKSKILQ